MSGEGWFAMKRGWRDNPLFRGEYSRAEAWVWLIENACWKPTKFDIKGKIITLQRGQLCASRERLATAWGWSPSAVERFLTRLQTEQMIGRETGQGKSVLTISNYAKYQDIGAKTGQKSEQATGQKSDRNRTAKEQGNKGTIEVPDGTSPPLAPRRDDDWIDLPDWLPAEPWNGWLEMRDDKRKWPTPRAVELTVDKLTRWRAKGHDPGPILDEATENSWTTIYEPKAPLNGHSAPNQRFASNSTLRELAQRSIANG